MRWAVFDIDGTLIPHTSTEKIFLKCLLFNGLLPLRNIWLFFLYALKMNPWKNRTAAFKANKMYLKDFPVQATRRFAARLIKQQVLSHLSVQGVATVREKREAGYRILFLSGAPNFLVEPLARYLNADFYLASTLEVRRKRFTGRLEGRHPYGEGKTHLLLEQAVSLGIDFPASVAYANHRSDADHLALFGTAVAVNPDRVFEKISAARNWPVVYWD